MGNENTYIIPTSILITHSAFIAQSGERQTEDLVVAGSIPAEGIPFGYFLLFFFRIRKRIRYSFAATRFLKKKNPCSLNQQQHNRCHRCIQNRPVRDFRTLQHIQLPSRRSTGCIHINTRSFHTRPHLPAVLTVRNRCSLLLCRTLPAPAALMPRVPERLVKPVAKRHLLQRKHHRLYIPRHLP